MIVKAASAPHQSEFILHNRAEFAEAVNVELFLSLYHVASLQHGNGAVLPIIRSLFCALQTIIWDTGEFLKRCCWVLLAHTTGYSIVSLFWKDL